MKILYYDCFSGISGDMNLGAMTDLGVSISYLENELGKLKLDGWKLKAEKDQRHGIHGTKVSVILTSHEHHHRHLGDIEEIINKSELDEKTKELSLRIFRKVAEAESLVHRIPVELVHFHEVGAVDSIVDIVGAAICFNALEVDEVHVSRVELGSGFVKCAHGTLPVPAPATAEIIKGLPVRTGGVDFEATTPTGAAIVATLGNRFGPLTGIKIHKTGYGVGHREHPDVPNLLRVFLGEPEKTETGHDALLIECNIDDMIPEFFDNITERLKGAGVSDVYITNIIMKKGRPGNLLSVICETGKEEAVKEIIFSESTSVGLRTIPFRKDTLERKFDTVETVYGPVTVKRSYFKGRQVSAKPEYDECKRIAGENNLPVKEVYNKIMAAIV
ncbi:MAG: nickel pincer cofactor biosynthesis protein LarC [Bacteroidales bacterium]|nr:nickel pincer cofactor biosynthesis protein LarC [Bacteroidales bacterium]MBN2632590.1 nickel pincer cofactor biosynthesis protein LarC [Bacteroidales bacterium]